jgi:hypothetical protein
VFFFAIARRHSLWLSGTGVRSTADSEDAADDGEAVEADPVEGEPVDEEPPGAGGETAHPPARARPTTPAHARTAREENRVKLTVRLPG